MAHGWAGDSAVRSSDWNIEELGLVSSIHMVAHLVCSSSTKGFDAFFWPQRALHTFDAQTNILVHINKIKY